MATKKKIDVKGSSITILSQNEEEYICITDIARYKNPDHTDDLIRNWLRNRNTIEFLGIWEQLSNPNFNSVEFDGIRTLAGLNSFAITPKQWIEKTNAIGITSKTGRYGGTYAHSDIAFEFASWVSVEFKLYLIKELQRLKKDENQRLALDWQINRTLSKLNYHIHTDAIKTHIIPSLITPSQEVLAYASEADLLNVALFGKTAKQWREANPTLDGNIRDYATVEQLLVLANLESMNAEFIAMGLPQKSRLKQLNEIAIRQLKILTTNQARKLLKG